VTLVQLLCWYMATSVTAPATNAFPPTNAFEEAAKPDGNERTLVQRAQRGDPEAFATLFQLHKSRVHSLCLMLTKDIAEAEDMTQETFLRVLCKVNAFRGDSAFSTWLHRIAVNTVLMNLRRSKRRPMVSLDEPVSPDSPSLVRDFGKSDPTLSWAVDRISLQRAIKELPPGCRKIYGLHEVHGYQHHEIARILHCSVGNSKAQLHKAKIKMRGLLLPKPISVRRSNAIAVAKQEQRCGNDVQ